MNFDFSDDLKQLRDQARPVPQRTVATEDCATGARRRRIPHRQPLACDGGDGWLGAAIPEQYGGAGLGYEGLCVLAEELGRALAPVPFASSAYLATEALLLAGSDAQKRRLLPKLADGSAIGCLALAEGTGNPDPAGVRIRSVGGKLSGSKWPVMDGSVADFAIVVARDERGEIALLLADLTAGTVSRRTLTTIDPSRNHARIDFAGSEVEKLGSPDRLACGAAAAGAGGDPGRVRAGRGRRCRTGDGAQLRLGAVCVRPADRVIPGDQAQACRRVCRDRTGPVECLLRCLGACVDAAELPLAAATARVSATEAFHLASKENIQTHGGIGFTWDVDCHLYYRRSKQLALALGGAPWWKNRLVELIEMRNAA